MDLQFLMPASLWVEEGAVARHGGELSALGTRCLIITGPSGARRSGALEDVTRALDQQGIPWRVFDQVGQNPQVALCQAGGEAAREWGADFLVGIGGGSPLDAAKAVAVFAANPQLAGDEIYQGWTNRALPFALVGTTAGTGSEVTRVAVLTDAQGRKRSIGGRDTYAALSLGDPVRYTASLPRAFTVSTALDALCHAAESHFAKNADRLSRGFSQAAMDLLLPNLEALATPELLPDATGRRELYQASILAGLAINQTGTAFCHTMGYVLSEEYGLPHGMACAVFLGEYLTLAQEQEEETFDRLCDVLGTSLEELLELLGQHTAGVELPCLSDQRLEQLLDRWSGAANMARTPGNFDRDRQRAVARRVLQQKREENA